MLLMNVYNLFRFLNLAKVEEFYGILWNFMMFVESIEISIEVKNTDLISIYYISVV